MKFTRRQFLTQSAAGLVASGFASHALGQGLVRAPMLGQRRSLLLVFLDGGNDGLNTVVPYADDRYHVARPKLALSASDVLRIDDEVALHSSFTPLHKLYQNGSLCILHDVGYPQPDLSHFVSRDIWHRGSRHASSTERLETGWVARALADRGSSDAGLPPLALGAEKAPLLLRGNSGNGITLASLGDVARVRPKDESPSDEPASDNAPMPTTASATSTLDRIRQARTQSHKLAAQLAEVRQDASVFEAYPQTKFGRLLFETGCLLRLDNPPPVICVSLGGFDTHAVQSGTHAALLDQLARGLASLQADLTRDQSDQRLLTLVYSEFGRRVAENGSAGTDHGTAGPMFALGSAVRGGRIGRAPNLAQLDNGNLKMQLDYRSVFNEALSDWLGVETKGVFDGKFAPGTARAGFLKPS